MRRSSGDPTADPGLPAATRSSRSDGIETAIGAVRHIAELPTGTGLAADTTDPLDAEMQELYRTLAPRLTKYAMGWLSYDDSCDVVQDRLFAFWDARRRGVRTLPRSDDSAKVEQCLFRVVRRRVINHLRDGHRRTAREELYDEEQWDTVHEWMEPQAAAAAEAVSLIVAQVTRSLPARQREVHALIAEQKMEYDEVAATLNISPSCARTHMLRANRAIRKALADAGYRGSTRRNPEA